MRSLTAPAWRASAAAWLAWLLPVFAWAPLTYPGYFQFLSGYLPVFNLVALARGPFVPPWNPTFGQPYDLLRGEGPLPYLLAWPLHALGLPPEAAVKAIMGLSLVAGCLFVFAWLRPRLGDWGALVAGVAYLYSPTVLTLLYPRGAFAETLFAALLPAALWALDRAGRGGVRAGALLALVTAGAFMAQGGLALWAAAALLVWILEPRMPRPALLSWLVGVAFGLVLLGIRLAAKGPGGAPGAAALFASGGLWPHQLLQTVPPAGAFSSTPSQLLPPGLGLASLALAALVFMLLPRAEQDAGRGKFGLAAALAGVPVLLALAPVAGLWGGLPGLARTVTFPYQLLLVGAPWLALLAGMGARALLDALPAGPDGERSHDLPLMAAVLAMLILGSYGVLQPQPAPGPAPARPVAVYGEDLLALVRAGAVAEDGAGPVRLSVQWQALRPVGDDYTLFIHLVDGAGGLWGQHDAPLRTSRWRPGQLVDGDYEIPLRPGAPPAASLRVLAGLYHWQTGQRLPVGGDDKVALPVTRAAP